MPERDGFTLIELVVVVAVIGLLASVAVFALPDPRGRLIDEAERLAQRTSAARDLAIMQARDVRLVVGPLGYGFEQRRRGRWQPLDDRPFLAQKWKPGTVARPVNIVFDSSGMASEARQIILTRDAVQIDVGVGLAGDVRLGQ